MAAAKEASLGEEGGDEEEGGEGEDDDDQLLVVPPAIVSFNVLLSPASIGPLARLKWIVAFVLFIVVDSLRLLLLLRPATAVPAAAATGTETKAGTMDATIKLKGMIPRRNPVRPEAHAEEEAEEEEPGEEDEDVDDPPCRWMDP